MPTKKTDHSAENDAPFFWNAETGEPCPRRGNMLCALPWTPEHRHAHREPPLSLTVVPGTDRVSALGMVESLARVIPPGTGGSAWREPPPGWVSFGALVNYPGPTEFSEEVGRDGLPLWERVIPPEKGEQS